MSVELIRVDDDSRATVDFAVDYVLKPNGCLPLAARDGAEGVYEALTARPI